MLEIYWLMGVTDCMQCIICYSIV